MNTLDQEVTLKSQAEILVATLLDYYHEEIDAIKNLKCRWDNGLIVESKNGNIPISNLLKQSPYTSDFQNEKCSQKVSDLLSHISKKGFLEKRNPTKDVSKPGPKTSKVVYFFNLPSEQKEECLKYLRSRNGCQIGQSSVKESTDDSYPVDRQAIDIGNIELDLPVGTLSAGSQFYIERTPCESICTEAISQPGALLRVKAPEQMGKTSLLFYLLKYAEQQKYRTVFLNLAAADKGVVSGLDSFLNWFCSEIAQELSLEDAVSDEWNNNQFSSSTKCSRCFSKHFLVKQDAPLLIAIDEVDQLFPHKAWADDFFKLLRVWNDKSKSSSKQLWRRLLIALTYSTEDYVPLNIKISPFNVGVCVPLEDFQLQQVNELAQRYALTWTQEQIKALISMVGGHPYLIHRAVRCASINGHSLEKILEDAPTASGIYKDHLYKLCNVLKKSPLLKSAFQRVLLAESGVDLDVTELIQLSRLGLIKQSQNQAMPRNALYHLYFKHHLY